MCFNDSKIIGETSQKFKQQSKNKFLVKNLRVTHFFQNKVLDIFEIKNRDKSVRNEVESFGRKIENYYETRTRAPSDSNKL